MRREAALRLRARSRKFFRLENFRPQGLLDARIAHAKEARAIGRVGTHSRFENADDLENPQRVVSNVHFFDSKDIDCFVLADRRQGFCAPPPRRASPRGKRAPGPPRRAPPAKTGVPNTEKKNDSGTPPRARGGARECGRRACPRPPPPRPPAAASAADSARTM